MSTREKLYASYAAHPSHESGAAQGDLDRVFAWHLRGWLPEDRQLSVLDLGCGDGSFLAFLARRGHERLVGVDRSATQVERSREAVPQAEIMLGDAAELLRKRPEFFGAIFCFDFLEHLTRKELLESLELIASALCPGGVVIARVPNGDSPFHDAVRYGDLTHEIGLAPPALKHLFRMSGLGDLELRECDPVPKSWKGVLRALAWRVLRQLVRAWNLVETGSAGSGVYTRVICLRGRAPKDR